MKRKLRLGAVALVAVVVAGALLLGYWGFIPSIAKLFGTDKPRDLGVYPTAADLASAQEKIGVEFAQLAPGLEPARSVAYEGSHEVDVELTDAEFTSLIQEEQWRYYPVTSVQVRFEEGVMEASGLLVTANVGPYVAATGGSSENIPSVLARYGLDGRVPFYVKGSASVDGGTLTMTVDHFEIGRFAFPDGVIADHNARATAFCQQRIDNVPGLRIDSASFKDDRLLLDGAVPDVELVSP